jgi:enoyl-CoA hydratase/carnithine racemase
MANIKISNEGRIGFVTMDRPPVNAMSTEMYGELNDAFQAVSRREDISVVLLVSSSERCFNAGADVKEISAMTAAGDTGRDERRQAIARTMFDSILTNRQPVIAVINGPALGAGAVIAACCDIRYASERATIGMPEINVGRCGGGRHMMRLLPQGKMREMYFTGRPIDAQEAYRLGLFERVVPHGAERNAAMELAREIASKSPLALRLAKEALNSCEPLPISEGYALEQTFTLRLARSEDAKEATRAFMEKRAPVWTGR